MSFNLCLISHATYQHVRGRFDVDALAPIRVKGKAEPIQVYVVRGEKPRAFHLHTRGVEGIDTRMIGRENELASLQRLLKNSSVGYLMAGEFGAIEFVNEEAARILNGNWPKSVVNKGVKPKANLT